MMNGLCVSRVFAAVALCVGSSASAQIFVDDDARPGGDGSSWGRAFNNLPDALAAVRPGDQVWVAEGRYVLDAQGSTFDMSTGSAYYGGFRGDEESPSQRGDPKDFPTILDGKLPGGGNAHHVVTVDNAASRVRIDGFTITGGNANGNATPDNLGGGVLVLGSLVTLDNLCVVENAANALGGGVYIGGDFDPEFIFIEDSEFIENRSEFQGGGLYIATTFQIDRCEFDRNTARIDGGGIHNETTDISLIFDTRFAFNRAGDSANDSGRGGAYNHAVESGGQTRLQRCTFIRNVGATVGAVSVRGGFHEILQCGFYSNETIVLGGSFASAVGFIDGDDGNCLIDSCLFSGNIINQGNPFGVGATVFANRVDGGMQVSHSTLVNNFGNGRSGGVFAADGSVGIIGSILFGNNATGLLGQPDNFAWTFGVASPSANQSIIGDLGMFVSPPPGTGTFDADPMFIDADGGNNIVGDLDDNVMLMPGSPAIDAGNSQAVNPNVIFDFYGDPRFADDPGTPDTGDAGGLSITSDIGAAEFQGVTPSPCPADINDDGVLTGADFNAFLTAFSAMDPAADQNNDGAFTGADFNAFLTNFSAGCN